MKIGKVMGPVHTLHRTNALGKQDFVLVHSDERYLAAVNLSEAEPGDQVLMVTGTAASKFCMDAPVDAVVVAVVDQNRAGSDIPMRNAEKSYEQTLEDAKRPM